MYICFCSVIYISQLVLHAVDVAARGVAAVATVVAAVAAVIAAFVI